MIPWLFPASTIESSVLVVFRLEVEGVIYLSPLRNLRPDAVDPGLRVDANRAVRPDLLVRIDPVRTLNRTVPLLKENDIPALGE